MDPKEMGKSVGDGIKAAIEGMKADGTFKESTTLEELAEYASRHIQVKVLE